MLQTGPHRAVTLTSKNASTVGEMFKLRAERSRHLPAIFEKKAGQWKPLSWGAFYKRAAQAAYGLQKLGAQRGDRVAILGSTKAPWAIYDMAAQLAGLVSLGIYPKQSIEQIRYLLDHSDAVAVMVEDETELKHVIEAAAGNDKLKAIVPWTQELYEAHADDPFMFFLRMGLGHYQVYRC